MSPQTPVPTPSGYRPIAALFMFLVLTMGLACVAPALPIGQIPTPALLRVTYQPSPSSNSLNRDGTPSPAPIQPAAGNRQAPTSAAAGPVQPIIPSGLAAPDINSAAGPTDGVLAAGAWQGMLCPVLEGLKIFDFEIYQTPWFSQPEAGASLYDPVFGSCLVRLTDYQKDLAPDDSSTGLLSPGAARQAFNADSSLVLVRSPRSFWYLYALDNMQPVPEMPGFYALEVAWDPLDPHLFYYSEGARFFRYDLRVRAARLIRDFALDFATRQVARINAWGATNYSADGRYWAWLAENAQNSPLALLVYDLAENRITARLSLAAGTRITAISFSPRGKFIVVRHENDCGGNQTQNCGIQIYNNQLDNPRLLLPSGTQYDTGLDPTGRDVLIYHDLGLNSISFIDLKNGQKQALWLVDQHYPLLHLHVSGRALQRPGWALVSTFGSSAMIDRSWMDNTIFAIELREEGRVMRLAHTYNVCSEEKHDQDWMQPQASPNLDLTRVLFSSNWGRTGEPQSEAYLLAMPEDWLELLP